MKRQIDITLPDLTGKLAVVTGGSDGVGQIIATRLAGAGAEVILPVRNPAKGEKAIAQIRRQIPTARISTRPMDLASLESVAEFTRGLNDEGRPINILINNAGVMRPPSHQHTKDGFELQWGTNHLGHFALTQRLLPLLRAGKARITHQASVAARSGKINWDDINWDNNYHVMGVYSQSKIAVGLYARELDARSQAGGWGITSNLSHPGVSPTNLLSAQPGLGRPKDTNEIRFIRAMSRFGVLGTPSTAALPALLAATGPDSQRGKFFGPTRFGNLSGAPAEQKLWPPLRNMDDARRVWDVSEQLIATRLAA